MSVYIEILKMNNNKNLLYLSQERQSEILEELKTLGIENDFQNLKTFDNSNHGFYEDSFEMQLEKIGGLRYSSIKFTVSNGTEI